MRNECKSFPNIGKETNIKIRNAYGAPYSHDQKRTLLPHTILRISDVHHRDKKFQSARDWRWIIYMQINKDHGNFSTKNFRGQEGLEWNISSS